MQISGSGYNYAGVIGNNPTKQGPVKIVSNTQYFNNSSSFVGEAYSTVFGPQDLSEYSTISITWVNNSVNNLKSRNY